MSAPGRRPGTAPAARGARGGRGGRGEREPDVEVGTGPTLPGWSFRAVLLPTVPLLLLVAGTRAGVAPGLLLVVAVLATAWVLRSPSPGPVHLVVVAAGVLLLGSHAAPLDPWALALAPLAYAVTRLAWWADHVPLRARVETAALRATLPRDAVVVGGTAALGAVALLVSGGSSAVAVLLGGAALVALTAVVVPREWWG